MKAVTNAEEAKKLAISNQISLSLDLVLKILYAQASSGLLEYIVPSKHKLHSDVIRELRGKGFEVSFQRPLYHREKHFIISWA